MQQHIEMYRCFWAGMRSKIEADRKSSISLLVNIGPWICHWPIKQPTSSSYSIFMMIECNPAYVWECCKTFSDPFLLGVYRLSMSRLPPCIGNPWSRKTETYGCATLLYSLGCTTRKKLKRQKYETSHTTSPFVPLLPGRVDPPPLANRCCRVHSTSIPARWQDIRNSKRC